MKWRKGGLIYGPDGSSPWARHSALQPTPFRLREGTIRVYCGFRDDNGVGRVGFVDVDEADPSIVRSVSEDPALDIGVPGAFDENGVVPTAVVRRDDRVFMYYAGYQLGQKVRFYVFGGVAVSEDGGDTFVRHTRVPVLDRTNDELFFRVAHSVQHENGVWRVWYGAGSTWMAGPGKDLPSYDIRYTESPDGLTFSDAPGKVCVPLVEDEFRVGRPSVIRTGDLYRMFYGRATAEQGYRMGYAESRDGENWVRKDDTVGIDVSSEGWDSQTIAYPGIIEAGPSVYMFYNGNDMARDGFGYAVLEHW